MISYEILKELLINGVKFQYESYDHKKAKAEWDSVKNTHQGSLISSNLIGMSYAGDIPPHVKQNHIVWRIGRVWEIFYNKKSEIWRIKIGCRYPKNFYLEDFGIRVKPILFKSDDRYDLITQGLAIEDKL